MGFFIRLSECGAEGGGEIESGQQPDIKVESDSCPFGLLVD